MILLDCSFTPQPPPLTAPKPSTPLLAVVVVLVDAPLVVEASSPLVSLPTYSKALAALRALVPLGVVTTTLTVPVPGGDTAVMVFADSTVKLSAAVEPKSTAEAPSRLDPLIVTIVPPLARPFLGLRAPTMGLEPKTHAAPIMWLSLRAPTSAVWALRDSATLSPKKLPPLCRASSFSGSPAHSPSERLNSHAAPRVPPSLGAPTSAVLPSADSATL